MKGEGGGEKPEKRKEGRKASTDNLAKTTTLVRKYTSYEEDRLWASRGLIGTVVDGASIPLIQNRVEDAGFKDIDIIPLGADKVFVHSLSSTNVSDIVGEAKQFFNLIFSNLVWWDKTVIPFQRGTWVRVYGIPLHAWNEDFFKLCVLDCGRYLRSDTCSLNRERFDYARILISTPLLEVLNVSDNLLVDGVLVDIKIVEELGINLGDDACLYEEDVKSEAASQEHADMHDVVEINNNVDILAEKIIEDLVDAEERSNSNANIKVQTQLENLGMKTRDVAAVHVGDCMGNTMVI